MTHTRFAVSRHNVFPLTDAETTKLSAASLPTALPRLSIPEQLEAIRKTASAAAEHGVSNDDVDYLRGAAGDSLSDTFMAALDLRKAAIFDGQGVAGLSATLAAGEKIANDHNTVTNGANDELVLLQRIGERISQEPDQRMRVGMLDILTQKVAAFDERFLTVGARNVPSAVDTVFRTLDDGTVVKTASIHVSHAVIGGRTITSEDLKTFDREAAAGLLTPEAMALADSIDRLKTASVNDQHLIVSFLK